MSIAAAMSPAFAQVDPDRVVAVVADMHVMAGVDVPFFLRDEINGIAKFVVRRVRSAEDLALALELPVLVELTPPSEARRGVIARLMRRPNREVESASNTPNAPQLLPLS